MEEEYPLERRIAFVLDFDLTLTEEYMQVPLFAHYFDNIKKAYKGLKDRDGNVIEFNHPADYFRIVDSWAEPNNGVAYVTQILTDIRRGIFPELTNDDLMRFGAQIKLAPGVPEFFDKIRKKWEGECSIDFHIISVGLDAMVRGSEVARYVDNIYATRLVSRLHDLGDIDKPILDGMANAVAPFTKSQKVIEIAKGGRDNIDKLLGNEDYVYDYRNIITLGDGLSDVSQFAYLSNKGSTTICVYRKDDMAAYNKIDSNKKVRDRVTALLPRDYNEYSKLWVYVNQSISRMLKRKCDFDQVTLSRYKKGKIRNPDLKKEVAEHVMKCPECEGMYVFFSQPPR